MAHAFLRIVPPSQRGCRLQWVGVCHLNASVPSRVVPLHQRVVLPRTTKRTSVEFVGDTGAGCVYARSGCDDPRPIVNQSTMFFEVEMDPPQTGVHVEITSCTVQTTAGVHGEVLTNTSLSTDGSGPHHGLLNPQKNRLTYTAFWDDVSNSPFHHIMCMYAIFNGTHASPHASGRAYLIADPNEHGILQNHS